jgi:hypothetical protein
MKRLAALLILAALPAQAQSPRDVMFPENARCYLREYSAGHLASHPLQLVEQIVIGPDAQLSDDRYLILRIGVYVRDRSDRFGGLAACTLIAGALTCDVEGDSGRFTLRPGKKGALTMTVGQQPLTLQGNGGIVAFGGAVSDDSTFLIPPVPADACP